MSQKRSKKRRNSTQQAVTTAQEQIGNAVENLINGLESIRETVVRVGLNCERYNHEGIAPHAEAERLERYSQELSSLVNDATRLKELCELCMKIEEDAMQSQSSVTSSNSNLDSTPQRIARKHNIAVPLSLCNFPANQNAAVLNNPSLVNQMCIESSRQLVANGHPRSAVIVSGSESPSSNVEFFSSLLREFYTSIRSGKVAIRADNSACLAPIPSVVSDVISRILAEHDVAALLPLFEAVVGEHVRKIRDSLVAIIREIQQVAKANKEDSASGNDEASEGVSLLHAYAFVKLYAEEYRALASGARSVALVLGDIYGDDSQLEKIFYLNWESMNKYVFYTTVYNDELIRDHLATCVRKLQTDKSDDPLDTSPELLAVINRCDPVKLYIVAVTKPSPATQAGEAESAQAAAENNSGNALHLKYAAPDLLALHDRVQSELETARIKRFLLDALQQTQSTKASSSSNSDAASTSASASSCANRNGGANCDNCSSNVIDPVLDRIQMLRDAFDHNRRLFDVEGLTAVLSGAARLPSVSLSPPGENVQADSNSSKKKRKKKKKKQQQQQQPQEQQQQQQQQQREQADSDSSPVKESSSSTSNVPSQLHTPCCNKCGTLHRISADAERIDRLLAERERLFAMSDAANNASAPSVQPDSCSVPSQKALKNVTDLLAKQSPLAQFIESIQNGEVHLCEHLQEEFDSKFSVQLPASNSSHFGDSESQQFEMAQLTTMFNMSVPPAPPFRLGVTPDSDAEDDALSCSNSHEEAEDARNTTPAAAAVASTLGTDADSSYYLLDAGEEVPPSQTAEQLEDFCKAVFKPILYAAPPIAAGSVRAPKTATSTIVGYPVVLNHHLYMLVNGAECPAVSLAASVVPLPLGSASGFPTVHVVPERLPDDIAVMLRSSLSSFNYSDVNNTVSLRRGSGSGADADADGVDHDDNRSVSMNVQQGVVFIEEPSFPLPTTDNSVEFHTKAAASNTARITVPNAAPALPNDYPLSALGRHGWTKADSRTAVHFSDDENDDDAEQLDADADGDADGTEDDADEDDYEDGDDAGPLPLDIEHSAAGGAGWQPGSSAQSKCNCQHCAFYGHPVAGNGARNQRALDSQERLRKKLALKQLGAQRTADPLDNDCDRINRRLSLAPAGTIESLEAIDAAERLTTKLFADFKRAVHDVVEKTVKHHHANCLKRSSRSKALRAAPTDEQSLDELVRYIEGGPVDASELQTQSQSQAQAQSQAQRSSKSEKRKRKKEKSKVVQAATDSTVKEPGSETANAEQPPKPTETERNEAAKVKEVNNAKARNLTAAANPTRSKEEKEKKKAQAQQVLNAEQSHKTSEAKTGSKTERERKGHTKHSVAEASSTFRGEELVIPDFEEVPISLDSPKGNRQHKSAGSRQVVADITNTKDKDRNVAAKRGDKGRVSAPVGPGQSAANGNGDANANKHDPIGGKTAAGVGNGRAHGSAGSVPPAVDVTAGAASKTGGLVSPHGDARERKANPRYRNNMKLEDFVRTPLKTQDRAPIDGVHSHSPQPSAERSQLPIQMPFASGKQNQRAGNSGGAVSHRHASDSNAAANPLGSSSSISPGNGSSRTESAVADKRPLQPQLSPRVRTYQNADGNGNGNVPFAQLLSTVTNQPQAQGPAQGQLPHTTPNSRHKARNFYPQHAVAASEQGTFEQAVRQGNMYERPVASGFPAATGWNNFDRDQSAVYPAYTPLVGNPLESLAGNATAWPPAWMTSSLGSGVWSVDDDRVANGNGHGNGNGNGHVEAPFGYEDRARSAAGDDWNVSRPCSAFSPSVASRTSDDVLSGRTGSASGSGIVHFDSVSSVGGAVDCFKQTYQTQPAVYSSVWQLPSLAPTDANAMNLNLSGGLFDQRPSSVATALTNSTFYDAPFSHNFSSTADELLQDADDDFDPEIEQFKQICMNETTKDTRERPRVQVNLSEIFKRKV